MWSTPLSIWVNCTLFIRTKGADRGEAIQGIESQHSSLFLGSHWFPRVPASLGLPVPRPPLADKFVISYLHQRRLNLTLTSAVSLSCWFLPQDHYFHEETGGTGGRNLYKNQRSWSWRGNTRYRVSAFFLVSRKSLISTSSCISRTACSASSLGR